MEENLEKFTSFHNRYYRSQHGLDSSNWLFDHISGIINNHGDKDVVSVRKFSHSWLQNSIIAR
jgi:leucyl aminopeptidase